MTKVKKKRKQQQVLPATIHLTLYTLDAWMRSFPESNVEEWCENQYPDDPVAYASYMLDQFEDNGYNTDYVDRIVLVTLDDEYFSWLESNHLVNSAQARSQYAGVISEAKATELLVKNHMNVATRWMAIPFIAKDKNIVSKNQDTSFMSPDTMLYLREYLEDLYETDVYVLPYYLEKEQIADNLTTIGHMANTYFSEGIQVRMDKLAEKPHNNIAVNTDLTYILYCIREKLDTATIDAYPEFDDHGRLILMREPECACFTKSAYEDFQQNEEESQQDFCINFPTSFTLKYDGEEEEDDFFSDDVLFKQELNTSMIARDLSVDTIYLDPSPIYLDEIEGYQAFLYASLLNDDDD